MSDHSQNDDGREEDLHDFVRSHPSLPAARNNPAAVIALIDEYATTKNFLMTLGQHKLKIIRSVLEQIAPKPKIIVELGTYMGYSALALGSMMKDIYGPDVVDHGVKIYSMELEQRWAAITNSFLEIAGLTAVVEVVIGEAADSIKKLSADGKLERIDVLLLDHWEDYYVSDLKVCEDLKLLKMGSIVFADNVMFPGAPEYLNRIKNATGRSSTRAKISIV